MTIVLQNQFENLTVRHNNFSVDLSFGGILQTITIPYEAITYFADPYAKFGLSLTTVEEESFSPEQERLAEPQTQGSKSSNAEVISIDQYRKK